MFCFLVCKWCNIVKILSDVIILLIVVICSMLFGEEKFIVIFDFKDLKFKNLDFWGFIFVFNFM